MKHFGKKGKRSCITIYINEQTDQWQTIFLLTETPLVLNYYYGHCYKTDTIMISCTKHYWHPQKRVIRMDSWTPSLGDGGLVHFSGPRLTGYNQLPLSPIVVTPTKVSLWNSILSLVHPHIVIQNKTLIRRSIRQMTTDRTLNLIWHRSDRTLSSNYLRWSRWWMGVPCINLLLRYSRGLLKKEHWSRDPNVAFWLEPVERQPFCGHSTNHHK